MLTREMNERLTRVGPGTPMGELLRRYWHPVAATSQLDAESQRRIDWNVLTQGKTVVIVRHD